MSENVAVANTQKSRKEKLKKLIEQAEVLGGCELPEQDVPDEKLTEELTNIRSRIRKREQKCVAPTK
jgi:hypothetical protein